MVRDYFETAGLGEYVTQIVVTNGTNSKSVFAAAQMFTDSYFINMLGIDRLNTPAAGTAEESLADIEVSLVLDVSGSMGWTSSSSGNKKIDDLIDAAQEFVFLMQCNPDDPNVSPVVCTVDEDTVSVSVIPYSEQVLVGETLLQEFNPTMEHTASSCVDFDSDDFWATAISLTAQIQRTAELDPWTNYRYRSTSSSFATDRNRSCKPWPTREILPFGNDYSTIQAFIGALTASGNTSIDLGMKWGTALLDPTLRPAVSNLTSGGSPMIDPAFDGRPFDYDDRGMQKVIVLMTDGENTSQHYVLDNNRTGLSDFYRDPGSGRLSAYRYYYGADRWWWPHSRQWQSYPYGGSANAVRLTYEEFWAGYNGDAHEEIATWLPDPFESHGYTEKNARLDAICDAAKAANIEVFTIGFETSTASNAIMQSCASSASHHFDVDGLDLSNAFAAIAREIHELRLIN